MPTVDLLVAEETVENMETNIGKIITLMERFLLIKGGGNYCNGKMQWKNAMEKCNGKM